MEKIYVLTEEFEGTEGIREFQIMGASKDKDKLKVMMDDLVDKDEYGLFEDNGIYEKTELSIQTEFTDEGFVGYCIIKQDLI